MCCPTGVGKPDLTKYLTKLEFSRKLGNALAEYVTQVDLGTALLDLVSQDQLTMAIEDFLTNTEILTLLEGYVSDAALVTELTNFSTSGEFKDGVVWSIGETIVKNALSDYLNEKQSIVWGMPLQSPWVAFGGGYLAPYYSRSGGRVFVDGVIKNPSAVGSSHAFTLPSGFRPSLAQSFRVDSGRDANSKLTIFIGGQGYIESTSPSYVSLAGVSFPYDEQVQVGI